MINFTPGMMVSTSLLEPDQDSLWVSPPNTTVSKLSIANTRQDHAGNYTCDPSKAVCDSIRLSVTKGNKIHSVSLRQVQKMWICLGCCGWEMCLEISLVYWFCKMQQINHIQFCFSYRPNSPSEGAFTNIQCEWAPFYQEQGSLLGSHCLHNFGLHKMFNQLMW